MTRLSRIAAGVLAAMTFTAAALGEPQTTDYAIGGRDRITGAPFATRAPVLATHGMAATAQPLASQIAIDVLKAGGSAVDAAIAANAALGLMEPVSCGIGGDLFAIVWDPKTRKLYGYNGSGRSPMGRSYGQMKAKIGDRPIPGFGSLSVTVPGAVDGWFALHEKFGRLPMQQILAPAIGYAKDGFPVTELIAYYLDRNMARLGAMYDKGGSPIEEFANARATYLVNGVTPKQGDIFRNPNLAHTYELIAAGGRDAYYKGEIARTADSYFRRIGGDLRYEDFAAHKGEWVEPASISYRGVDVYGLPPNSQGLATLQMLSILEGFDMKSFGAGSANSVHAMIEAKRLAFEDAARYYADPAFAKIPQKWLLSKAYAAERRALIAMDRAMPTVQPGSAPMNSDTTYLTVADKDGMMISIIQSNYRGMGSGLVADNLGFMFQDRGELYTMQPGHPNVYAPNKRPFQTIIPGFAMKDGEPWLSFGVMGGDMQPQGQTQIIVNMVDYGMNVQEAGDAARWHHLGSTEVTGEAAKGVGTVELESGMPAATVEELKRRGHVIVPGTGGFGGYQAIMRDPKTGVYWGASESTKDGAAIGY
ncbi:MAG: gamma-glutamyltransferase [Alphaproteobacteria bacterium]|nr:gamma-glutamyltransferase [Alphaproteobacteria bacterium]